MGFTWIHLNQVNVGTNIAISMYAVLAVVCIN